MISLSVLETLVRQLQGKAAQAATDIAALLADVLAAQADITNLQSADTALDGRLDALEAGWAQGTVNITWPGASQLSNTITVTHGFGAAPLQVMAVTNTALVTVTVVTFNATDMQFQCRDNSAVRAASTFGVIRWLARLV